MGQRHRFARRTMLLAIVLVAETWNMPAFGQATWLPPVTPATPNGFPQFGGDGSQSSAYDAADDRLIVFGGVSPFDNTAVSHDTWVLANASGAGGQPTWIKLVTTNDPPARLRHSAVYDPVTNEMIIFGGTTTGGGGTYLNDVWVLKNANGLDGPSSDWVQRTPIGGPPDARSQHGAIYDTINRSMAIFFGSDPAGTRTWSDVWVLLHANDVTNQPIWQIASQSGSVPPPVGHFAIGFDPAFSRVTLFGGCCGYSNASFVGVLNPLSFPPTVAWTALTPSGTTPPAGDVSTFGYDRGSTKLIALDIVPGDGTNGTWLLSDANGVGEGGLGSIDAWNNIIPGSTPGVPPSSFLIGSGYNPNSKILIDALNVVQNGNQVPQVWILKDADATFPSHPLIVGMGDSVAAGYGLGNDGNDFSYPIEVAGLWGPSHGYQGASVASTGAVSGRNNCTDESKKDGSCHSVLENQLPAVLSAKPEIVMLTVGANDIDFEGCLANFFSGGDIQGCLNTSTQLANLSLNLSTIFTQLHIANPLVNIYVTNYYDPLPAPPGGQGPCVLYEAVALERGDIRGNIRIATELQTLGYGLAEKVLRNLNGMITAAASGYSYVHVVPIKSAFQGHDMCQPFSPLVFGLAVNFANLVPLPDFALGGTCAYPRTSIEEVFPIEFGGLIFGKATTNCLPHPNISGQQALANCVIRAFSGQNCPSP